MKSSKIDVLELKKVAYEIVREEEERTGIKLKMYPVTFIEYYSDYIFKGKFNLIKKGIYSVYPIMYSRVLGFNDLHGDTVIFLNRIGKIKKDYNSLFWVAYMCYHEFRHSEQRTFERDSYASFLYDIESFIIMYDSFGAENYYLEHDKYSFEIGASIYGVNKAKEFLKMKRPDLYEKEKENISEIMKRVSINYYTYDASLVFDKFLETYLNFCKSNNKNYKSHNLFSINPILRIFFDENFEYKKMSEIVNDYEFMDLDIRIGAAIFSSKSFLKNIEFQNLGNKEFLILYDNLKFLKSIYNNQRLTLEKIYGNCNDLSEKYVKSIEEFFNRVREYEKFMSVIEQYKTDRDSLMNVEYFGKK